MAGFSDYTESKVIDALLRGDSITGGAVYIALFTTDPNDDATGAECADSGYTRQQAHSSAPSDGFSAPHATDGHTSNQQVVSFPAIVDTRITVTHWAIFDALTGGNMLFSGALTNAKDLDPSDVLSFPVGSLKITLS